MLHISKYILSLYIIFLGQSVLADESKIILQVGQNVTVNNTQVFCQANRSLQIFYERQASYIANDFVTFIFQAVIKGSDGSYIKVFKDVDYTYYSYDNTETTRYKIFTKAVQSLQEKPALTAVERSVGFQFCHSNTDIKGEDYYILFQYYIDPQQTDAEKVLTRGNSLGFYNDGEACLKAMEKYNSNVR